jgi:hypothetical protein
MSFYLSCYQTNGCLESLCSQPHKLALQEKRP